MQRRAVIKSVGSGVTIGSVGLAGCTGVNIKGGQQVGGGDSITIKWAGGSVEKSECWDCIHPMVIWKAQKRLQEQSDETITVDYTGGNELCSEKSCGNKVQQGILDVGVNSIANSTKFFPENDVFMIPYTVPAEDSQSLSHTAIPRMVFHEDIWKDYWIPFAQKYGVVPFAGGFPALRTIFMSQDYDGPRVYVAEDLEGLRIRRTFSGISETAISQWDATPVDVSWGDAIQGMKTGVVDGLETWTSVGLAIGLGEISSQVTVNNWQIGYRANWANVEWLKSLSEENRSLIADVTKELTVEIAQLVPEVVENRVGQLSDPPPDGSRLAETDTMVNLVGSDQMDSWRSPIDPQENRDLYSDVISQAESLSKEGIYDRIYEIAQDPPSVNDFGTDDISWWDDYLDEI